MSHTKPLTAWQHAAALATEGACLLPLLLSALGSLVAATRPPYLFPAIPAAVQPTLLTIAVSLLYGAVHAPLCLWRTAYYVRLCGAGDALPSLRPTKRGIAALSWRWHLWWRRAVGGAIACAPSALMFRYGSIVSQTAGTAAIQPALWLVAGAISLVVGIVLTAIWQCRYALAPLFLLRGIPASAAMALSARAMRRHLGEYINFLGNELPHLIPCILLIPAAWRVPAFRRRRAALLLGWMPPGR